MEEYAHVLIKASGITGVIIAITETSYGYIYTIEADKPDKYGYYPLFFCAEEELEAL